METWGKIITEKVFQQISLYFEKLHCRQSELIPDSAVPAPPVTVCCLAETIARNQGLQRWRAMPYEWTFSTGLTCLWPRSRRAGLSSGLSSPGFSLPRIGGLFKIFCPQPRTGGGERLPDGCVGWKECCFSLLPQSAEAPSSLSLIHYLIWQGWIHFAKALNVAVVTNFIKWKK